MLALRLWKRSDKNYRQSHFCPWSSSSNNAGRYSQTAGALLPYCDLSIMVRASFSWRRQSQRGIFHRSLQKNYPLSSWLRASRRNGEKFFNQFRLRITKFGNFRVLFNTVCLLSIGAESLFWQFDTQKYKDYKIIFLNLILFNFIFLYGYENCLLALTFWPWSWTFTV